MKLSRKIIIFSAIALIAGSGAYTISRSGIDVARAITDARCSSGAFVTHSDKAAAVAADSDSGDAAAPARSSNNSGAVGKSAQAVGDNLIANPGVDLIENGTPPGWQTNIFGKNDAKFKVVAGHASDHALRTEIANRTDGDADWYSPAVTVTPGAYYEYSDSYRSDVTTRSILALKDTKGDTQYINLKNAPASKDWAPYRVTFFVPQNVTQAMVFHPIAAKGFLETDDFSLVAAQPQGFTQPIVSLTFDDGWRSIHDNALPLMIRYGLPSTQYVISGYVGQAKDYAGPGQLYDFQKAGHEIASHTVDHLDLTKLSAKDAQYQLDQSKKDIAKCYGAPTDYAAPYGTYNAAVVSDVQKDYQTGRSTDAGFNTADNFNPYGLLVQNMTATTSQETLNGWLETARANHAWLILVYHQIDSTKSDYARQTVDFEHDLQTIKASGLPVKTMKDAYSEVKPQIKP